MTTTPRRDATGDLARTFAEYVPSLEARDIVSIRPAYGLVIDGAEREARDGRRFPTIEPATGDHLADVAEAGPADVDDAVAAARRAYEERWRDLPGRARGKYLFRLARLLQDRSREFAVLESIDGGKPIRESRDVDVPLAAAHLFHHAGWADKLEYAVPGMTARPLGVVGQIIPWNFPLLMAAWKIAPALACGNTVVLKPAETTPLTALLLAELIAEAELPPGVVNVVTGAGPTGAALAAHPGVDKVAFTGSTERGQGHPAGRWRAPAPASRWSWAARAPTWSSTTPRWTRRSRASWTGSSSTRATSAAPARGCWCRRASPTTCSTGCAAASSCCAPATRWTRTPTWAPSTPRPSSSASRASWTGAAAAGCRIDQPERPAARARASSSRPPS